MQQDIIDNEVFKLFNQLENLQYEERDFKRYIPDTPVIYKEDLRKLPAVGFYIRSTSGSTGQPLNIGKTKLQCIWNQAAIHREYHWRNLDVSKNIAVISALIHDIEILPLNLNPFIYPTQQGKVYTHPLTGNLQEWIDYVPCDYLFSYPSVIKNLNTTKFKDILLSCERGGTSYSCEEAGIIALTCPDNPSVMHVMENIIMEINDQSEVIITDLCHPHVKRYWLGDIAEWATCTCGRKMQTIKSDVIGRIRNLALAEDGSRFWPVFGTISFASIAPNMLQYQCVQTTQKDIELRITGKVTEQEIIKILELMKNRMGIYYNYEVKFVDSFPLGKHEEFICLV